MTLVYIAIAVVLVLLNGFFVLAEFALVKVRVTRLKELMGQGNRRAHVAHEMVEHLDRYLSSAQLGITVASLGLGWVGEPAFARLIDSVVGLPGWWKAGTSHAISTAIGFLIITFLHLLIGEQAPKMLAIRRAEQCLLAVAYPLQWSYRLSYLPMIVLNGACNLVLRAIGLVRDEPEMTHSEQELRMLLTTAQTTRRFSLNRLLMLENIFDLGHQSVRDAMIPWPEVRSLSRGATITEVLRLVGEHRFSRWPVIDPASGTPVGYLLTKDLIVEPQAQADWTKLVRPLRVVAPGDGLEPVLQQLQTVGANMAVVMDGMRLVGLITLEDILEEVVGRIEDEYPRLPRLFLKDALAVGGIVLDVEAAAPEQAIRTLAAVIPRDNLPANADVATMALDRERQMPTDVGHGVAIPHARVPGLVKSVLVFGRAAEGIVFSEQSEEPVRLIFLLITPAERPNLQVFFLAQLANIAESELVRERMLRAETALELLEIIAAADPAITG
jgi:CBS domain containing-hemolysin-like protein/mannitol/fructose-specific phosphotransferase system IIA component (Ntr-type)